MLGTPGFTERVVEEVLASGRYQRHTRQVRSKLLRFRQRAHALLHTAGVEIARPVSDGMFIWGRLPGLADADALVSEALARGILLAKGSMFSPDGKFREFLRFNAAHCCETRLADFLRQALPPHHGTHDRARRLPETPGIRYMPAPASSSTGERNHD
jgi:DNA-binding transcriptional MocR family regulator